MSEIYTVVGDCHCKPNNLETIEQLFSIVEEIGGPVIWLGDMLDTKDLVRARCLNAYYSYFKSSKLDHIVLVGNHDQYHAGAEEHSLETLKALENVEIIDKPTLVNDMLMAPYYHDLEKFRSDVLSQKARFLFMHQGVTGFDYGNGFVAENEISLIELKGYEKVVSGHFHAFQEKGNLTYLGTPFSHSFGETDQKKYLGIFDADAGTLETVETPFPRHVTVEIDLDAKKKPKIPDTDDHIRVILTGSRERVTSFDKTPYPNVKFIDMPQAEDEAESAVKETDSNVVRFVKWAEMSEIEPETVELGLEILTGVEGV